MARLFTCGFELQDMTTAAPKEWGVASGVPVVGPPSISTLVHRAGLASMRCNPAGVAQYIEHQVHATIEVKRTFHRFYLRVAAFPDVACTLYGIGQSGFFPAQIRLLPDGSLRLFDDVLGEYTGTDTSTIGNLALNTWYRVEIDFTDGATGTGAISAYLNGQKFSGEGTTCSVAMGFSRLRVGALTAVTGEWFIDDIAVNDEAGVNQNTLPGPGSVVHLRPNAAGDNNMFATVVGGTAGAANNYTRASEVTPDDATSYNGTVAAGVATIDDFNVESPTAIPTGASIKLVAVGARVGSTATTAASLVYRIKSQAAGTVAESASASVAVNGWASYKAAVPFTPQLVTYVEPQAGGLWTKALLETMQIGYRSNVDQTTVRRVSSIWAMVEFVAGIEAEELKDDFSSGAVDPNKWPNAFGTVGVVDGRGQLACTDLYNGISSAKAYTLAESYIQAKMYPPDGINTDEHAYIQMLVKSEVEGTDLAVEIDTASGTIGFLNRTSYWDPDGVVLPWDKVRYSWVRIRETGGTLFFETSLDSVTWTQVRSIASPAYVNDANLELQFIAHRDLGTADFAYFDNVNTGSNGALKVWDGTKWVSRSLKVWDGDVWNVHPMRVNDGVDWRTG